jgi:hypothetical protein
MIGPALGVDGPEGARVMSRLWDRVAFLADGPVVGFPVVPAAEVVARLEAGEPWDGVAKALKLEPGDVVAAVAAGALGGEKSLGPTLTQASPTRPKLLPALSEPALAAIGPKSDRTTRLALAAGLLQIHDFWEASHVAAQSADDLGERRTSAYWHAIAHRREPDYGNASYWFRRVGRHPIFDDLLRDVRAALPPDLDGQDANWTLVWNPNSLVSLCSSAQPGSRDEALARRFQRIEMIRLLEASAEAAGIV